MRWMGRGFLFSNSVPVLLHYCEIIAYIVKRDFCTHKHTKLAKTGTILSVCDIIPFFRYKLNKLRYYADISVPNCKYDTPGTNTTFDMSCRYLTMYHNKTYCIVIQYISTNLGLVPLFILAVCTRNYIYDVLFRYPLPGIMVHRHIWSEYTRFWALGSSLSV